MLNIDDLLNSLKNPNKPNSDTLENTKETWERIGKKDAFLELGLESSTLDTYLKDWIKNNNPYSNI